MTKYIKLVFLFVGFSLNLSAQNYAHDWARQIGGNQHDDAKDMVIDANGNVYVTGYFNDTVDFDPGPGTFTVISNGGDDIYLLKLDSIGNFLWVITMGNTSGDRGISLATDASGDVYLTGYFTDTVDFDPGPSVFNLISTNISFEMFICKYNASGSLVWAKQISGSGQASPDEIKRDPTGNLYSIGSFYGTCDFDPGPGTYNLNSAGGSDLYVCKLDPSGNFLSAFALGSSAIEGGTAIEIDASGNVFFGGVFSGTFDVDPGPGVVNFTSNGSYDFFITKLNSAGNFLWSKQYGGSGLDYITSICLNSTGEVFGGGYFFNTVDFDPGVGTTLLTSAGIHDAFVTKLDAAGEFVWVSTISGTSLEVVYDIALDGSGNIITTGSYSYDSDFDPGSGTDIVTSGGHFISRYDASGNYINALRFEGSSDGYALAIDGNDNYYCAGSMGPGVDFDPNSGVFTLTNPTSYLQGFVHRLKPCISSPNGSLTISACNGYLSPSGNNYWTQSGVYQDIMQNVTGCDSIIDITLTINLPTYSLITPTACNVYNSPSGNFSWTTSGLYHDTITNAAGCDSMITIFLIVNPTVTNVVTSCNTLISNATNATYQWLDCDNNFAVIPGATDQIFEPTISGNYAVEITQNGCVDTSACNGINTVGLNVNENPKFSVYPNPTLSMITVTCTDVIEETSIYTIHGVCVMKSLYDKNINVEHLKAGTYILESETKSGIYRTSFVKK